MGDPTIKVSKSNNNFPYAQSNQSKKVEVLTNGDDDHFVFAASAGLFGIINGLLGISSSETSEPKKGALKPEVIPEKPFVSKLWSGLNDLASVWHDSKSVRTRDFVEEAVYKLPFRMSRDINSGDFTKSPGLFDPRLVTNFIMRYFGAGFQRAVAWEDFAMYLDRWGWRMSDIAYDQAFKLLDKSGMLPEVRKKPDKVFESKNFYIDVPVGLLVGRSDGGHLVLAPKAEVLDRMHFTSELAVEYIMLSMAAGQAMTEVMKKGFVRVERLNFKDMGNWRLLTDKPPRFHEHILGRARGSYYQVHGEFMRIPPKGSKHFKTLDPIRPEEIYKMSAKIGEYFERNLKAAREEGVISPEFFQSQMEIVAKLRKKAIEPASSYEGKTDGAPSYKNAADFLNQVPLEPSKSFTGYLWGKLIVDSVKTRVVPRMTAPIEALRGVRERVKAVVERAAK